MFGKAHENMKKRFFSGLILLMILLLLGGCKEENVVCFDENDPLIFEEVELFEESSLSETAQTNDKEDVLSELFDSENSESESQSEEIPESESLSEIFSETESDNSDEKQTVTGNLKLIVIDAGHQIKGNSEKEPIGPSATETKAKVTGGATGCETGQKEYELNLAVALLLKEELLMRGYEVIMVRETNDVNISNSERAAIANNAGADAFIRVHANGSENSQVSGTETLCQTPGNPYNAALYPSSRKLSEKVLDGVVLQTGFKKRNVVETDTMSGINWCSVPTTIIEMGFLSNPQEDKLLYTQEYRKKVAVGIADGIDAYFTS